jgi:hypothetical protein
VSRKPRWADSASRSREPAERAVRYGYSVRSQFPAGHRWDDQLERRLELEWEVLTPAGTWPLARDRVRRGWDYAERTP